MKFTLSFFPKSTKCPYLCPLYLIMSIYGTVPTVHSSFSPCHIFTLFRISSQAEHIIPDRMTKSTKQLLLLKYINILVRMPN